MPADNLLSPLSADQRRLARREILRFQHRLSETGLFADEALVQLLNLHPRAATTIRTLRPGGSSREAWISGAAEGMTGAQILKQVRTGRLEVRLEGVMTADPACRLLLDRIMGEFQIATGLMPMAADGAVVISSPGLAAPASIAAEETMTWHVRGPRLLYAYPPARDPALPWAALREDQATPVMLDPGQGLYPPLHSPVRPINGDALNVSVEITFATPRSRMNDLLRRMLGRPAPARPPITDDAPRFDLTGRGLVWRDGEAPFWAPAPVRRAVRKRAAAPKLRKAA
jgi:hypothetical protein